MNSPHATAYTKAQGQTHPYEVIDQFKNALRQAGVDAPSDLLADGQLHRCDAIDRRGKHDACYLLFLDGVAAGGFQNWRDGQGWQDWRADIGRTLTTAEQVTQREIIQVAHQQREADDKQRKTEARERASLLLAKADQCIDHLYLTRKGVAPHGIKQAGDRLVIPMRDVYGLLHSLQFIDRQGSKRFLTGGRKRGCFHLIGNLDLAGVMLIAEGYATGATLHEVTAHPVAVSFDAGNLKPVAQAIRAKYPDLKIVICADDDYLTAGNPGITCANEAAQAVGGVVAVPRFGSNRPDHATDFNDLHQLRRNQGASC